MEQTDIKEIIKESLSVLKEKIVIALQNDDAESIEKEIDELSVVVAKMITNLEELAFDAGRLREDDGEFVFDDFDDFQNA
ncbi:hypothetical protein HK413_02655 [Mucilaginibacter sp. S1162]|uniref:Uncharacterized protein n=1 Tax=Mucilaginibacter humi TaxID=2732510 RepID=A0ABX1W0Z9_9SPHI|nr:hypothetical protein [Mucilaginibacter humi]NNU33336.1 hypothetical protein [Mucilaginibacter humi]